MFQPLLADLADFLQFLVPVIIFVGWLLSQFVQNQGPQAPKQRRPAGGARPPQPRPEAIEQEIAEFLRQAQQQGPQQAGDAQAARQRQMLQPEAPRRIKPQPVAEAGSRQKRSGDQPRRLGQKQPAKRLQDSVADHVREHLDTGDIERHTSQLGRRVRSADSEVEQHLHKTFDHQMGQLDDAPVAFGIREGTDDAAWDTLEVQRSRSDAQWQLQSDAILRMVRNPHTMREAIIIGELLKPPVSLRTDE